MSESAQTRSAPDEQDYKAAVGRFPSGVTVLTAHRGTGCDGVTVSAFMSVSLDPLLVAAGVRLRSTFLANLVPGTPVGVNVLDERQWPVAEHFADPGRERGVFTPTTPEWSTGAMEAPLLAGTVASLGCRLERTVLLGDHALLVLAVRAVAVAVGRTPLLHYRGRPHRLRAMTDTRGDAA